MDVRLLRRARTDAGHGPHHRQHRVRRCPGRRARERRPRGGLVVVRVGGTRPVSGDTGHGEPRPRQPPVPLCDHRSARWPPPRGAGDGCCGLPTLRPRLDGDHGATTRARSDRRRLPGVGCLRLPRCERRLGPAMAPVVGPAVGRDPLLHALERARPGLGVGTGRRPAVVHPGRASRRRVLPPEWVDLTDHWSGDHRSHRRGLGRGVADLCPLAGHERAGRAPGGPDLGHPHPRPAELAARTPVAPAARRPPPPRRSP